MKFYVILWAHCILTSIAMVLDAPLPPSFQPHSYLVNDERISILGSAYWISS